MLPKNYSPESGLIKRKGNIAMRKNHKFLSLLLVFIIISLVTGTVFAASFPKKPVQLICAYPPGGVTDLVARAIASTMPQYLGQPVVVIIKSGGSGTIGTAAGAMAKPDGYTLTEVLVGPVAIQIHQQKLPYKNDSFEPVALISKNPIYFSVRADSPWKTLKDFVDSVKDNPGKYKYGHSGTGALPNLDTEHFLKIAGLKVTAVPFDGGNQPVMNLLGGHIDAAVSFGGEIAEQVRAGSLRVLGVFSDARSPLYPNVSTFKEQGYDVTAVSWRGIAVPKGTPPDRIKILHDALKKTMEDKTYISMVNSFKETVDYLPSDEFGALWRKDYDTFKKLVQDLGLGIKN